MLGDSLIEEHHEEGTNGGSTAKNERKSLVGCSGLIIRCMHWDLVAQKGFFFLGSELTSTHLVGDPLKEAHPEEDTYDGSTPKNERKWLVGYFSLKIRCMHWDLVPQKGIFFSGVGTD